MKFGTNVDVVWDVPVPTGTGRASRRRSIKLAMNKMVREQKSQVCFRVSKGDLSDSDARKVGDILRSSVYNWRNSMGKSAGVTLPDITTTVTVTGDTIELHVFDKERAVFALE